MTPVCRSRRRTARSFKVFLLLPALLLLGPGTLAAQGVTVRGIVTRADGGLPLEGATVVVAGTGLSATTTATGRFTLSGVPVGRDTVHVMRIGFAPITRVIAVDQRTGSLEFALSEITITLSDLTVTAVSRVPERLVSAPGAVATIDATTARDLAVTGQPALALTTLPGADIVQTDVQDFNINARGFNTVFNRRVLVLQDGRDLAIAFLGSQEWLGMTATLEDMAKIEFVRGPSAALYGANAFAGVLNLTTPLARETPGGRISVGGGELSTLRTDLRYGGVFGDGRWGYRLTGGYSTSEAWAKSRTNLGDLAREYAPAIDTNSNSIVHPFPGYELAALNGQAKQGAFGLPGPATGMPDPVTGLYGTARLDYYAPSGSILTVEAGDARTRNATLLGSAARFQITESRRPWARVAWNADHFNLMAYYSGRDGLDQKNLAAGTESVDHSHLLHVEGQYHRDFEGDRGRVIVGGSARNSTVNTDGTLVDPRYDDRTDHFGALFGQLEYRVTPKVRAVLAGRYDASNLFSNQLSPKAALVFTPGLQHSFRASVGRAFEMPNALDFFVSLPAGPPADFTQLEDALRASALGPALSGVPAGRLFTNSAAVPLLALGNRHLKVERVTSWEAGYRGQLGPVSVELDGYVSIMRDFVTDVLPGVNPDFAPWTAPDAVPADQRDAVAAAVRGALIGGGQALAASALTRLEDGSTAMVLSVGNAGKATVRGLEADATWRLDPQLEVNANASLFGYHLTASSFVAGDLVLPNTPARRGNLAVRYHGRSGLDLMASVHATSAFQWAAGPFVGPVPSTETVNATASYHLTPSIRVQVAATDLFDQRRYQNFGGAVIGRRILGAVEAKF
jgi:iron complex outermembrane receptor protein